MTKIKFYGGGFFVFCSVMTSTAWSRTQIEFTSSGGSCEGALCIEGSFAHKTLATLVSSATAETCIVKTGKKHLHPDPSSEITNFAKCKEHLADFDLAIFDMKEPKLRQRKANALSGKELSEVEKDFYKSAALKTLIKEEKIFPEGNKGKTPLTLADIKRRGVEGYSFHFHGELMEIVRVRSADGENPGGYFVRMKEHWSRVSSDFSRPEDVPLVFSLRSRIFIKTSSSCQMTCAKQKDEIYEFNGRSFRIITRREYTKPDPEAPH